MDISGTIDLATQPLIEQIEAQQKEIEQLKEDLLISNNSMIGIQMVNTKLKEENKALLGVIEGMKLIIKNLENK